MSTSLDQCTHPKLSRAYETWEDDHENLWTIELCGRCRTELGLIPAK